MQSGRAAGPGHQRLWWPSSADHMAGKKSKKDRTLGQDRKMSLFLLACGIIALLGQQPFSHGAQAQRAGKGQVAGQEKREIRKQVNLGDWILPKLHS